MFLVFVLIILLIWKKKNLKISLNTYIDVLEYDIILTCRTVGELPMIIGAVLKAQTAAASIGIIEGADGPTAIMVVGVIGAGSVIAEIIIG